MEEQLTFGFMSDRLRSSRPPEVVRRSRILAKRSEIAEALAPAVDSFWYEVPPLAAYVDLPGFEGG